MHFSSVSVFSRLFKYVKEASLFSNPTYAALIALLDNYQSKTGQSENFSSEQIKEQENFINECIQNTELGKKLYDFLHSKGFFHHELSQQCT